MDYQWRKPEMELSDTGLLGKWYNRKQGKKQVSRGVSEQD